MRAHNRKKRFGLETDGVDELSEVDLHKQRRENNAPARADEPGCFSQFDKLLVSLGLGGINTHKKMGLTVFIGCASGLCGAIVMFLSYKLLANPKLAVVDAMLSSGGVTPAFFVFATISCLLSVTSSCLVIIFSPSAGGSGVPECKTYLNGALYKDFLENPYFCAVALVAISFAVASDLPVGHESPLMHIAASIACVVCKTWQNSEQKLPREQRLFTTDRARIMFITVGSACGLAAAFRSPLGAVTFAFEELATHWNFEMLHRCMIGAAIASLFVCYIGGAQSILTQAGSMFDLSMIHLTPVGHASSISPTFRIWEMLFIVVLGAMGGVTGAVFVGLTTVLTKARKRMFENETSYRRLLEVLFVTLLSSFAWVVVPSLFPCRELSDKERASNIAQEFVHWKQYTCPEGQVGCVL